MTKFSKFDASEYLDSEEVIAEYIAAAAEDGNPDVLIAAIEDVAKARGMAKVAKDAKLGRESLYKVFKPGAQPRFGTILSICNALNLRMTFEPVVVVKPVKAKIAKVALVASAPKKKSTPPSGKVTRVRKSEDRRIQA